MLDLVLLKYCDVKKREDRCYAIAKSNEVNVGDRVFVENSNRTLEVIKISRSIDYDTLNIIAEKNKLHKVCGILSITPLEMPVIPKNQEEIKC